MALLRAILLGLLALALGGCFVLDELEWGAGEMEKHSINPEGVPARASKRAPAASALDTPTTESSWQEKLPDVETWWKEARTLISSDKDESIVRCRIRGRDQFMRIDECQVRGGQVGS